MRIRLGHSDEGVSNRFYRCSPDKLGRRERKTNPNGRG